MKSKRKRIPLKNKTINMEKHDEFVVMTTDPGPVLFLTGYNVGDPPSSTFGNLENAIIYDTLEDAQHAASLIGGGTVGTTKPS